MWPNAGQHGGSRASLSRELWMKRPSWCPPDAPHERESLCHFLKTTEPPKHKSAISAHPQPEKRSVIFLSPGRKVDYVGFIEKYSSLQSGRPL